MSHSIIRKLLPLNYNYLRIWVIVRDWEPWYRGVHPSEVMMHFPSVSDFPSISENFSDSVENFRLFPKKIFDFHPQKFLTTILLVIHYLHFFAVTFSHFPPDLIKFTWFSHTLCVFRFLRPLVLPWCIYLYASHNARTGRYDSLCSTVSFVLLLFHLFVFSMIFISVIASSFSTIFILQYNLHPSVQSSFILQYNLHPSVQSSSFSTIFILQYNLHL